MKKIIIILAIAFPFFISQSFAQQWTAIGNDIYNNNSGNVGIGTTTPASNLHVYNSTDLASFYVSSPWNMSGNRAIGVIRIENPTSGDLFNLSLRYKNGRHEMIQSVYSSSSSSWLAFTYLNLNTGKYEMRNGITDAEFKNSGDILFNNTGAIGVGMGSVAIPAGVKMAVNGKINCKEVEVTLTGWSDFVFADDYQLRSLGDVEAFIKTNNHLPDVPSAKEVLENGVNVGEMNSTLLRKIEELTLYMIELKKENEQMKAQIETLMEK